ncbi:hypothetical protein BJ742DRAFT_370931 [Cladochytrium replicatum]|nr:hypothetical protein BJ742DRAFT_370931 [Cladochytrium replicatum]
MRASVWSFLALVLAFATVALADIEEQVRRCHQQTRKLTISPFERQPSTSTSGPTTSSKNSPLAAAPLAPPTPPKVRFTSPGWHFLQEQPLKHSSAAVQCILSGDSIPLDAGSRCMCDAGLRTSLETCFDCRGAGSDFKQLEKVCSEGDLAAAAKIASDSVFNQTREAPALDIQLQVPESFVPTIGDLYASADINTSGALSLTIPVFSLAVAAAIAFFAA